MSRISGLGGFLRSEFLHLKRRYATYLRVQEAGRNNIRIGEGAKINPQTRIGAYTFIGRNATVGRNCIEIGSFCSVATGAVIAPNTHPLDRISTSAVFYSMSWQKVAVDRKGDFNLERTLLGHDVWVGCNSIILPGVKVGDGAVIGAGAVVTRDVEPYSVVVGSPARVIRKRFPEDVVNCILEAQFFIRYDPQTIAGAFSQSTLYDGNAQMTCNDVRSLVSDCDRLESAAKARRR